MNEKLTMHESLSRINDVAKQLDGLVLLLAGYPDKVGHEYFVCESLNSLARDLNHASEQLGNVMANQG